MKPHTAYQRLLDDLRNDGRLVNEDGGRAMAQCPAHDDTNPSLAITAVEGQVLVHCHAGCLTDTVMKSLGRSLADLYDDRKGTSYRYSDGRIVNRKAGKRFSQHGNTKGAALYHVERIGDATTSTSAKARRTCMPLKRSAARRSARRWVRARPIYSTGPRCRART